MCALKVLEPRFVKFCVLGGLAVLMAPRAVLKGRLLFLSPRRLSCALRRKRMRHELWRLGRAAVAVGSVLMSQQ